MEERGRLKEDAEFLPSILLFSLTAWSIFPECAPIKLLMSTNAPAGVWCRWVLPLVSFALSVSDKHMEEGFEVFGVSLIGRLPT